LISIKRALNGAVLKAKTDVEGHEDVVYKVAVSAIDAPTRASRRVNCSTASPLVLSSGT
jgi:hypothetical protein